MTDHNLSVTIDPATEVPDRHCFRCHRHSRRAGRVAGGIVACQRHLSDVPPPAPAPAPACPKPGWPAPKVGAGGPLRPEPGAHP